MEKKSVICEFKVDHQKRTFEGYASTFGNVDRVDDTIAPGAFKESIDDRFPRNMIKVMWQHEEPLGIPLHMEEDSTGLFTVGKVSRTSLGKDALILMEDRVVDKLSIGFTLKRADFEMVAHPDDEDREIRQLNRVRLHEYSPVTFAADEHTSITGVKTVLVEAVDDAGCRKELERILRQSGFSRSAAMAFISKTVRLIGTDAQDHQGKPDPSGQEQPEIDSLIKSLENLNSFVSNLKGDSHAR